LKKYILPFLPLALGALVSCLWQGGLWPNPLLYLQADLGTWFLLLGLLGSVSWGAGLIIWLRAERRCRRALAELGRERAETHRRFLRRLDHELKNPLTAMRAGLANLADQVDGSALSGVRAQVNRLVRLSADLRKLAELGTQPIELEAVDLDRLLAELVESVQDRPESETRNVELVLPRAPWPLPPVAADQDLLFLALHNLLDNAFKFSRPGDTIEMRAFEDGMWVVIEIADTGPGIPDDELPHIGEELYRGSTARDVDGSGLGLALVKAIVACHEGTMNIRSRLGQGTVITLHLPITR